MTRYLAQRLLTFIPTIFGISILVFGAIRLIPGDQITAALGTEAGMLTDKQREAMEAYYGIDKPPIHQYFRWLGNLLQGNMGISTRHGPILDAILKRLPLTLELALFSLSIALIIGIPIGILSALKHNSLLDLGGRIFAMIGLAIPSFVLGAILIYMLSVVFKYLPNSGNYTDFIEDPLLNLRQLAFPAITLGTSFAASVMRMTRSSVLEVRNEAYVQTARSKGLSPNLITRRHILRNALIPVTTLIGIEFGYLLGGAFIVEHLFSLPGIGRLAVFSISQREYALIQGISIFVALTFVCMNLLVDVIYVALDPRISYRVDN